MKISDFLSPTQVMVDVKATDKARLLEQLSMGAAAEAGLPAEEVVREIAKREELGSTGVGNGVALPHARLPSLKAPFALLARLRHPIEFDAIDGERVDIVVLLLIPETGDGAKGNALACVARALRDAEALRKRLTAKRSFAWSPRPNGTGRNVREWHKADVRVSPRDVRKVPETELRGTKFLPSTRPAPLTLPRKKWQRPAGASNACALLTCAKVSSRPPHLLQSRRLACSKVK